jgi:hypothetical protein
MQKEDSRPPHDPLPQSQPVRAPGGPDQPEVLTMVEIELPDGRYLVVYGRVAPSRPDA